MKRGHQTMQNLIETFFSVIQKLEEKEIPYMVVGSNPCFPSGSFTARRWR